MPYLLMIAIQVACIVDVIRNGRNQLWIMALVFLPIASAIAYVIVEVLPGMRGNRHIRTVQAKAVAAIDPDREVRAARSALDLTDTVANRMRLADALAALGKYGEALPLYHEAIAMGPVDMRTAEKLARAEFETGDAAGALERLDDSPPPSAQSDRDRQGCCAPVFSTSLGARRRRWRSMPISSRACPAKRHVAAMPRC